jgi:hypothetical protein
VSYAIEIELENDRQFKKEARNSIRNKKTASVSEGRFAFAGIDFICPVSRAVSAAWAACRYGRRRSVQTGFLFHL